MNLKVNYFLILHHHMLHIIILGQSVKTSLYSKSAQLCSKLFLSCSIFYVSIKTSIKTTKMTMNKVKTAQNNRKAKIFHLGFIGRRTQNEKGANFPANTSDIGVWEMLSLKSRGREDGYVYRHNCEHETKEKKRQACNCCV